MSYNPTIRYPENDGFPFVSGSSKGLGLKVLILFQVGFYTTAASDLFINDPTIHLVFCEAAL